MKVYLFELGNLGHCSHYQAIFETRELAEAAKEKYLNDPDCTNCPEGVSWSVTEMEVHTDLTVLDPVKEAPIV